MILAVIEHDWDSFLVDYDTWDFYHSDTFSPDLTIRFVWEMKVAGKTYAEKKADLQSKAIDFSNWGFTAEPTAYAYETATAFFEKYGRRYGLLREFRENGIC